MIYVVIPTYQEHENIADTVSRILALPLDIRIVIVDDDSTDGTKDILDTLTSERVHVIHRAPPRSFAGSYIDGFSYALNQPDCQAVLECDADGSHPTGTIPQLVLGLEVVDVAIGSRYIPGGNINGFSRDRLLLSSAANLYLRWVTGLGVKDITAGFVAYRADFLKRLPFISISSNGYAFQIEMKRLVHSAGGRMQEFPITFIDRSKGQSKMSFKTMVEAFMLGLKYRFTA